MNQFHEKRGFMLTLTTSMIREVREDAKTTGGDVYTMLASKVFEKPISEVIKAERQISKYAAFGLEGLARDQISAEGGEV